MIFFFAQRWSVTSEKCCLSIPLVMCRHFAFTPIVSQSGYLLLDVISRWVPASCRHLGVGGFVASVGAVWGGANMHFIASEPWKKNEGTLSRLVAVTLQRNFMEISRIFECHRAILSNRSERGRTQRNGFKVCQIAGWWGAGSGLAYLLKYCCFKGLSQCQHYKRQMLTT